MRLGSVSHLALGLALLLAAPQAHAEDFNLFKLLAPKPANTQVPGDAPVDGTDGGVSAEAPAPLPQRRPASAEAAPAADAAGKSIAALPAPQSTQTQPALAQLPVPLPPRRPHIEEASALLLLQVAPKTAQVTHPAPAAPAMTQVAAPTAAPVRQTAPAAPQRVADTFIVPAAPAIAPVPGPRSEDGPVAGLDPRPVRVVAIKPEVKTAGAAPQKPAPKTNAKTAAADKAKAAAPTSAHTAPQAPAPAPAVVAQAPKAAPEPELLADPMPEVVVGPRDIPVKDAVQAVVLAQTPPESAVPRITPVAVAAAAPAARPRTEDGLPPQLPPDPSVVAEAMLQRIPTVTSALAGIVSAVGPTPAQAAGQKEIPQPPADTSNSPPPPDQAIPVERSTGPLPYEQVRRLQRLQDRIATGDTAALQAQRALIAEIEDAFHKADPKVWQDPRNARAAVVFFLSGGSPKELRNLLSLKPAPAIDERLLQGALAYVEGRPEDAERYLANINPLQLPDALGGQIAMVQAAVTVGKDPRKAMAQLDIARLVMPGTLVEEAALRREILVAAQLGELNKFEHLSKQYLYRFRHSVYAGNFRQRFAAALTRMAFVNDRDQFQRLVSLLQPLDRDSRVDIYLMVARGALNQGKFTAASLASERVLVDADPVSTDAERARVYKAAVNAASSKEVDAAVVELKSIIRSRLPPDDVMLLNAALTTAELVRSAGETVKQAAVKPQVKVDPMQVTHTAGTALLPKWTANETVPVAQPATAQRSDATSAQAQIAAQVQAAAQSRGVAPGQPPAGGPPPPAPGAVPPPPPQAGQPARPAPQAPAAQTAQAGQPAAAPAPEAKQPSLFDEGSPAGALVSRAQGTLDKVDAMLKESPL
ncbi:chemotaxis protein MotC [Azorhizobium sp. AG788]|uniref:hypothetical protein n=2 Tax=Azorhizobium TaxID=6 RepID=UPI00105F17FD|nr:hypothetical protein [Azorhizobium sp. AG788]TDT88904.1 chemotaxis protein MotC [Azorhizobium sp. AG788]